MYLSHFWAYRAHFLPRHPRVGLLTGFLTAKVVVLGFKCSCYNGPILGGVKGFSAIFGPTEPIFRLDTLFSGHNYPKNYPIFKKSASFDKFSFLAF